MLDRKSFARMRGALIQMSRARQETLGSVQRVITLSKRAIYARQRGDSRAAGEALAGMKKEHARMLTLAKAFPGLLGHQSVRTASQELVEAACYLALEERKALPAAAGLKVDALAYMLGVADLTGELVRSAVLAAIDRNKPRVSELREILRAIYAELIAVEARDSDLRRKIDKAGYDLEKVENLLLDLR